MTLIRLQQASADPWELDVYHKAQAIVQQQPTIFDSLASHIISVTWSLRNTSTGKQRYLLATTSLGTCKMHAYPVLILLN